MEVLVTGARGWIDETLGALTLDEKIALLAGQDLWSTVPIERLGVPSLQLTDGPNGVRGFDDRHGRTVMSYPVGVAMGATFHPDLIREVGRALGAEASAHGASVLLGPTMNIPRVPNAGRNFECFSEDPVLSGTVASAYIEGVQSQRVAACIKHVVCNDQETDRFSIDARVDERTLREIYLEPFRLAVAAARPWAAMSAYNTVNGTTASEHALLDDVLRDEYGFDGLVVSDWYGTYSAAAVTGGLDLEMPGPARWLGHEHVEASLASGAITVADIDRKVRNLLRLIERTGGPDRVSTTSDGLEERPEFRALARRAAAEATVLLTNDGTLPLSNEVNHVAVIGGPSTATFHQGGGSSSVRPHRVVSILEGLRAVLDDTVEVTFSRGCAAWHHPPLLDPEMLTHDGRPGLEVRYMPGPDPDREPVRTAVTHRSELGFFGPGDRWVDYDDFSLRLRGEYTPQRTGTYRFSLEALGHVRAWMAGEQRVEAWDQPTSRTVWELHLRACEPVDVAIEYASPAEDRWRSVRLGVEEPEAPEELLDAAIRAAAAADVAVVVVGLGPERESEGFDRPDLRLPPEQDRLVAAVAAVQPDTVVVLTTGSPVELPWLEDVRAVVQAWYGGQEVGHAVADVLTGAVDPGGRLPITWPASSRQHPGLLNYPGEAGAVRYGEGVFVGYRAYDQLELEPLFGFGHGLSYATFELRDVRASVGPDQLSVLASLVNTSSCDGSDVVQVFAHGIGGVVRRLVGFSKVQLAAGNEHDVQLHVPLDHLAWWDPAARSWSRATGPVTLEVRGVFGQHLLEIELPMPSR
jgi:beta-glucosidase